MSDSSNTLSKLMSEVARIMHRDDIDPDVSVGELGVDSLMVVELMLACDQIYPSAVDMDAPQLEITQFTTLRNIDDQLSALVKV